MVNTRSLWLMAILCTAACAKKEEPSPSAKSSEATAMPAPAPPAAPPARAEVPITSKYPEAIAAFKQGRDLNDQLRFAEAIEFFNKAIQLDPDFALAHAHLGMLTPGVEGETMLRKASTLAAALPEAEKTYIEAALLQRQGEDARSAQLLARVGELAPGEWRVFYALGLRATNGRKFDEAIARYKQAAEANPESAVVHNGLAYAYAAQRRYDDAVAAAKKQTELLPNEPNPQDTLGEILLMAGRFPESEAAYLKAIDLSPKFAVAWEGVALARFYRADWSGGYAALAKGKQAAALPEDRVLFDFDQAWAKLGEGKPAEAMKLLDTLDQSADIKQLPQAWVEVAEARAAMSYAQGKYADAGKQLAQMQERADKSKLPGVGQKAMKRRNLVLTLAVQSKQGKGKDADKTLAAIAEASKDAPPQFGSALVMARGLQKWATGDLKGAITELSGCWEDDFVCHWELAMAQEKAGDKAGAEATRKQIGSKHYRDPAFLWFSRPQK